MESKEKRRVRIASPVHISQNEWESRSNESINARLEKSKALREIANEADKIRMAELLQVCKDRDMMRSHIRGRGI